MARLPRYALPGQPQHVIQRGNNRLPVFVDRADYERFRHDLVAACARYGCAVHAYVLMTNHFHLLLTAPGRGALAKAMQSLGARYVAYFNRRHRRTGTLWEGRFRSVPIDCERYLFTCYRYIEQNPVRAGIVDHPANINGRVITPMRWGRPTRSSHDTSDTWVLRADSIGSSCTAQFATFSSTPRRSTKFDRRSTLVGH